MRNMITYNRLLFNHLHRVEHEEEPQRQHSIHLRSLHENQIKVQILKRHLAQTHTYKPNLSPLPIGTVLQKYKNCLG